MSRSTAVWGAAELAAASEPAPAAACYFPTDPPTDQSAPDETLSVLTASIDVLEAWGFSLETTDTELGLVSASRERELIGYYDRYDYDYGYYCHCYCYYYFSGYY